MVNRLRSITGVRKVGHAGTLDPFATGLLLVCFAGATKQVDQLMALEKEYIAIFEVGKQTDTDDITGSVINERPFTHLDKQQVVEALEKYRGEFLQVPPAYSAVKVKGRRLYKLARQGKEIEAIPRRVTIYDLQLQSFALPDMMLKITCARGTYIRALARDVGNDLGCGAFVRELRRTRIGDYRVEDAMRVDSFERDFIG